MQKSVTICVPAKVNLSLDVLGPRPDGYHELVSVMQAIRLYDTLVLERIPDHPAVKGHGPVIELAPGPLGTCSQEALSVVPLDETNHISKAVRAMENKTGTPFPVRVKVFKDIPVAAGLAGGSADAAAAICGLNELWGLGLSRQEMADLGSEVGSDVPFFFFGGTALATGRGEHIRQLRYPGDWHILVVKPPLSVSTPFIYKAYDHYPQCSSDCTQGVIAALEAGDFVSACRSLGNDLQPVTSSHFPIVARVLARLKEAGAPGVCLSGSGPSVYALVDSPEQGQDLRSAVEDLVEVAVVTKFCSLGVETLCV